MPGQARLDAPGVLHHVIIRGIERRKIFRDKKYQDNVVDRLIQFVSEIHTSCNVKYRIEPEDICAGNRERIRADARGRHCCWAVRELGYRQTDLAGRLGMSQPGVGYAGKRGERLARENRYRLDA